MKVKYTFYFEQGFNRSQEATTDQTFDELIEEISQDIPQGCVWYFSYKTRLGHPTTVCINLSRVILIEVEEVNENEMV